MTGGEDPTKLTAVESFLRKGSSNRLSDTSSAGVGRVPCYQRLRRRRPPERLGVAGLLPAPRWRVCCLRILRRQRHRRVRSGRCLTKHIAKHFHFVKEKRAAGLVVLKYLATALQVADMFTKQIFPKHFERLLTHAA